MTNELDKKASKKPPVKEGKTDVKKTEEVNNKRIYFVIPALFVLIIIFSFLYFNNQISNLKQQVVSSENKHKLSLQNIDDQITNTRSHLASIEKNLDEIELKQDVLANSLSEPEKQQIHINKDYALAEIEHLLIIASYNLELDHNIEAALSAMESADKRLAGFDDPNILNVREQLITDINQLRSVNQSDLGGLGLFLSDLINRVDYLPLKEDVAIENNKDNIQNSSSTETKSFFKLIWHEIKSLVIITRDEDVGRARLIPEEIYFLRANIKLELANARFAVFNRDTKNLQASVEHIQTWLNEYFDLSDAGVQNIYDSLNRMKKLELAFPEVNINSSLESVRALIRHQDELNGPDNMNDIQELQ